MQNVANLEIMAEAFEGVTRKTETPVACLSTFGEDDLFVSDNCSLEITTDVVISRSALETEIDEMPASCPMQNISDKLTSLHGCIEGKFNEDSIKCLLVINEKQHETILPIQLFVDADIGIEEGAAFLAELKIVDGFKSLVVSPRPPQQNYESKQEIYDILAKL